MSEQKLGRDKTLPLSWRTIRKEGDILLEAMLDAPRKQFLGKIEIEPHENFHYIRDVMSVVSMRGVAGAIIDKVNRFLESEQKIGLLMEVISPDSQHAYGIYERRGWRRADPRSSILVYVPEGLTMPSISEAFAMKRKVKFIARRWSNASD